METAESRNSASRDQDSSSLVNLENFHGRYYPTSVSMQLQPLSKRKFPSLQAVGTGAVYLVDRKGSGFVYKSKISVFECYAALNAKCSHALHRYSEAVPQDALRRTVDVVPREALYRSSNVFQGEVSRQNSELDPFDFLHRHYEIVQEDPFELLPPDPSQRRVETIAQDLSQPREDFLSLRNSDPLSTIKQPLSASEDDNRELVLKILCSTESAGDFFLDLRLLSQTDVSISLGDTLADCDERLITITASENPKYQKSPAQEAIDSVFNISYDRAEPSITARLVVCTHQIGCLLGEGGSKISEMQKKSEASIQILKVEQNPKCVSENDRVVQISGRFFDVKDAIYLVTSRLRDDLFFHSKANSATKSNATFIPERISHGETLNPVSMGFQPSKDSFQRVSRYLVDTNPYTIPEEPFPNRFSSTAGYASNFGRRSTMDLNGISHHSSQAPSRLWASPPPAAPRGVYVGSGGLSSTRADLGIDSGLKYPIVTNTTVEIRVPENAVNFVCGYGEDGHNLVQVLEQITGARVIVHKPRLGARDRIITISGTPDQTQVAEKLLRTFILTGISDLLVPSGQRDFSFAFNKPEYSDRLLKIVIEPLTWGEVAPSVVTVKEFFINSLILSTKSEFFYKLFSNGMIESRQKHATLFIDPSEEYPVTELLKFMYSSKLLAATEASELLDLLVAADKFSVSACVTSSIIQQLLSFPMTTKSAIDYLACNLFPWTVLMAPPVKPLIETAQKVIATHYRDVSEHPKEEVMSLPLLAIEAIFSSDGLLIATEDSVYNVLAAWTTINYSDREEQKEIFEYLSHCIRFSCISFRKLEQILLSDDLEAKVASKLVLEALIFKTASRNRQRALGEKTDRPYKYRVIKLVEFDEPVIRALYISA